MKIHIIITLCWECITGRPACIAPQRELKLGQGGECPGTPLNKEYSKERIKACLSTKMFKPSHRPLEAPQGAEWGQKCLQFFSANSKLYGNIRTNIAFTIFCNYPLGEKRAKKQNN
jgi:hypothetical protein